MYSILHAKLLKTFVVEAIREKMVQNVVKA